jgi:hypothetical protein
VAHARGRRPIRCTKYTFGESGVTLKPWSQALPENVPADANARFEVEAMGVAIGALPAVERDHNAYTVRVVLRDIFDHSGNTTLVMLVAAKSGRSGY